MLQISSHITIPDTEIEIHAVRAQGAGGQHVNKVSSAIHLRFDIGASSLPALYKERLLKLRDHRISEEGILTIKAQQSRSQDQNRDDAIERLRTLIQSVAVSSKTAQANGSYERFAQTETGIEKEGGSIEGVEAIDRIAMTEPRSVKLIFGAAPKSRGRLYSTEASDPKILYPPST